MRSNYEAVTRVDRLLSFFGVVREGDEAPVIAFPTNLGPFIRLAEDGSGLKRVNDGASGLLPGFAKELAYGRKTYNAFGALLTVRRNEFRLRQRHSPGTSFAILGKFAKLLNPSSQ